MTATGTRTTTTTAGTGQVQDITFSPAGTRPTWLEASVKALVDAREPLRAREIVEIAQTSGYCPDSTSRTPWQSVNRDLHAAIRRGDDRVVTGPGPGQFQLAGTGAAAAATSRSGKVTRGGRATVPRLPIEPLEDLVEARGGLRSCGVRHESDEDPARARWVERLLRGYLRSRRRGWTSIYDADELSIKALGIHPSQVWGDGWWDALDPAPGTAPASRSSDATGTRGSAAA